jgi:hypothetical protein
VSWRYGSSYCGWAPLPPSAHFAVGHGFYHNSVSVGIGFEFGLGCSDYVFVSSGNLCNPHPQYLSRTHSTTIYKDTTIVNNYGTINKSTVVNNGAGFERIQRATRGNIRQVALKGTSDVRNTNTRREVLDADGKTLTVAQPAKVLPTRDGSASTPSTAAIHPRTDRRVATAPAPKETSASTSSGFADTGTRPQRADLAGSTGTVGGTVPRTGFAPRSSSSQANASATTAGTVSTAKPDATKVTPSTSVAHEPKNPFAPVTVRGVPPRSARNEQPMVSDNPAARARSEPTPNFSQPAPVRPATAHAPAPNQFQQFQPRPRATIPSAPAPSSSGNFAPPSRVAPAAAPRVESRHVPTSPPALQAAPRADPAPAPPSASPSAPSSRSSSSSGGSSSGGNSGGGNFGGFGRR